MKYSLACLGLIGIFLYVWGMRRNHPRIALFGLACLDLEFAIVGGVLLYARSYLFGCAFTLGSLYLLTALLRSPKKQS